MRGDARRSSLSGRVKVPLSPSEERKPGYRDLVGLVLALVLAWILWSERRATRCPVAPRGRGGVAGVVGVGGVCNPAVRKTHGNGGQKNTQQPSTPAPDVTMTMTLRRSGTKRGARAGNNYYRAG